MTRNPDPHMPILRCSAVEIIDAACKQDRRILLFGPPGVGKSTLAAGLGRALSLAGRACRCIGADPGSPGFGIPGTVARGRWHTDHWAVEAYQGLCTLDAGRFRLPLVTAVGRLARSVREGTLLIDGPGLVRGAAGAELLAAIIDAAGVAAILALTAPDREPPLLDELESFGLDLYRVHAAAQAKRPGKRVRARHRTALWDAYLSDSAEREVEIGRTKLVGTPPPRTEESAWTGRLIGFLERDRTLGMGEIARFDGRTLTVRVPKAAVLGDTVLVRDALRGPDGLVETAEPFLTGRIDYLPPADTLPGIEESGGPRVAAQIGRVDVGLLNGVFGDPLLHVRLRQKRRSLLFDLGDGARLPARLAHQVSDVFISHAHMDHISGFQWFLRSRLSAELPACRVYGPPGLARHIAGFIQCFLWDRIGTAGPRFEIGELHGDLLRRTIIQAGAPADRLLDEVRIRDGALLEEPGFRVRAVLLDHRTPVLAYAFEPDRELNVRKDRLKARGLEPGPWLATLKTELLWGRSETMISLPDGTALSAGSLGDQLVTIKPGRKFVYATDLADSAENRRRLIAFADRAHTFFCESPFLEADWAQARRTGHLTTRACGEIAAAAGVGRLVPFHFSRRYSDDSKPVYEEIRTVCGSLIAPKDSRIFESPARNGAAGRKPDAGDPR